jgi:hypothetical protein
MAGSTSFTSNSVSSVSPLLIDRISSKVQHNASSNGGGKLISKKSLSSLHHKVMDHNQPTAMTRKSSVFTIENLLASPCSKNLNLNTSTTSRTNSTSLTTASTASTGLATSDVHSSQQANHLFAPNFFSVISNPHHAIPHINLVDPITYGYSYLGNSLFHFLLLLF